MTKADKIIIWAIVLISLFSLIFQNLIFSDYEKTKILIEVGGKLYASYETDKLVEPKEVNIETKFGENKLIISKDGAEIVDSDCRDKACLGKVSKNGEFSVCLPHRLIVRAEGIKEVDGVAY